MCEIIYKAVQHYKFAAPGFLLDKWDVHFSYGKVSTYYTEVCIKNYCTQVPSLGEMSQRGPECKELVQYLQELREILRHKLLTTPEEERERMAYLNEISKRERQNAVIIEKLEGELKEKNDDKDEEVCLFVCQCQVFASAVLNYIYIYVCVCVCVCMCAF